MGLEYLVGNIVEIERVGDFDIVTAAYLFPYASTFNELEAMRHAIEVNLVDNGRFVGITLNPNMTHAHLAVQDDYGVYMNVNSDLKDGAEIELDIDTPYGEVGFTNHFSTQGCCEKALLQAGFKTINWYMPRVSNTGYEKHGETFWKNHLAMPGFIIVEGIK